METKKNENGAATSQKAEDLYLLYVKLLPAEANYLEVFDRSDYNFYYFHVKWNPLDHKFESKADERNPVYYGMDDDNDIVNFLSLECLHIEPHSDMTDEWREKATEVAACLTAQWMVRQSRDRYSTKHLKLARIDCGAFCRCLVEQHGYVVRLDNVKSRFWLTLEDMTELTSSTDAVEVENLLGQFLEGRPSNLEIQNSCPPKLFETLVRTSNSCRVYLELRGLEITGDMAAAIATMYQARAPLFFIFDFHFTPSGLAAFSNATKDGPCPRQITFFPFDPNATEIEKPSFGDAHSPHLLTLLSRWSKAEEISFGNLKISNEAFTAICQGIWHHKSLKSFRCTDMDFPGRGLAECLTGLIQHSTSLRHIMMFGSLPERTVSQSLVQILRALPNDREIRLDWTINEDDENTALDSDMFKVTFRGNGGQEVDLAVSLHASVEHRASFSLFIADVMRSVSRPLTYQSLQLYLVHDCDVPLNGMEDDILGILPCPGFVSLELISGRFVRMLNLINKFLPKAESIETLSIECTSDRMSDEDELTAEQAAAVDKFVATVNASTSLRTIHSCFRPSKIQEVIEFVPIRNRIASIQKSPAAIIPRLVRSFAHSNVNDDDVEHAHFMQTPQGRLLNATFLTIKTFSHELGHENKKRKAVLN